MWNVFHGALRTFRKNEFQAWNLVDSARKQQYSYFEISYINRFQIRKIQLRKKQRYYSCRWLPVKVCILLVEFDLSLPVRIPRVNLTCSYSEHSNSFTKEASVYLLSWDNLYTVFSK